MNQWLPLSMVTLHFIFKSLNMTLLLSSLQVVVSVNGLNFTFSAYVEDMLLYASSCFFGASLHSKVDIRMISMAIRKNLDNYVEWEIQEKMMSLNPFINISLGP